MTTDERDLLMRLANLVHDHLPDVPDDELKYVFHLMIRVFNANDPTKDVKPSI